MSRIWVTGEGGYLANRYSHWCQGKKNEIVNSLLEPYYDYFRTITPNVKRKEISLFDPTLKKLIEDSGAEFIVHAQFIDDISFCDKLSEPSIETNIEGTAKIARIARELSLPLIFISDISHINPSEEIISSPQFQFSKNVYDVCRKSAEDIIKVIKKDNYTILYVCSVFGEDDVKSPISNLIKSSLDKGYNSVEMNLDPSEQNQFLYCDDFCSALDAIIGSYNEDKGFISPYFNVVPNDSKTLMEVIEIIEELELPLYEYEFKPHKDVYSNRILDNKILREIGWESLNIKDGIKTMVDNLRNVNDIG